MSSDWWSAGQRWLEREASKETASQKRDWVKRGRSAKTFRYNPPEWHRDAVAALGRNAEETFKAIKLERIGLPPLPSQAPKRHHATKKSAAQYHVWGSGPLKGETTFYRGTDRRHSGTMFTAKALQTAGISCGHEAIYTLHGCVVESSNVAEVAWEAVLALATVPSDIVVAHQTRDPIAWINSWLCAGEGPAWGLLEKAFPGFCAKWDRAPIQAAMWLWVEMNRRCARRTDSRYRVEDLREVRGATILKTLCEAAKIDVDLERIRAALAATNARTNHHPRPSTYVPLTWECLPSCLVRDEFARLARIYGY